MSFVPVTPGSPAQPAKPREGETVDHAMSAPQRTLDDRLETAGEGLVLLLIAALLLPSGMTEYVAVAGVGALLLGLNVARVAAGIRVRWLSITIGAWAVIGGVGAMAGLRIDALALFFLLLGLVTLGAAAFRSR